jgi:hypothetical protein
VVLHPGDFGQRDVGIVEHAAVGVDDCDPHPEKPGSPPHELVEPCRVGKARLDLAGEEVDLTSEAITRAILDGPVGDSAGDRGQADRENEREQSE